MEIALIVISLVTFIMGVENTRLRREVDECKKTETVYPLPASSSDVGLDPGVYPTEIQPETHKHNMK